MIVYLDINVVLDFLLGNRAFSLEVAQLLTLVRSKKITVYTAPNAIIMGFAFLRKGPDKRSEKDVKHTLALFRKLVHCVSVTEAEVDKALTLSSPKDLEDGFQVVLAQKCGADVFITNDRKGFKGSPIKTISSKQFLLEWEF
ncbi:MAG: type II toxin-antitoxin system VapC family toxin [Bacteroidota bacterium]